MTSDTKRPRALWPYAIGLAALALMSMLIGKYPVAPTDLLHATLGWIWGASPTDATVNTVIWSVRFPRILAALGIGASLAAAGATFQGLFRNPLVSPDILGVSSGASLGAVLGIFLSLPVIVIQAASFVGGLLAVGAVYAIGSAIRHRDPVLTLVLAGVAVGAVVGAGISLIKILADPYDQLPAITYWLLGSLTSVTRGDIFSILPALAIGLVPLFLFRWRINLMTLGDEEAKTLGIDTRRLRLILIASATLITAASVSISGVIGWVGLVIPHIARMLVGPDFRRLLPTSMVLGAAFLLIVDILARSIAQIEVPLGILTAALGAPFFIWLLASGRRGWQ
ncbi:iron ABC transporter permease [Devosia epidermidihirudinis]|uniref:Iron ABC transporter permease n=1 Tax=Devosia epidermidihirudinis TaxID=1293439 RepID=A0A0F5QFJ5_9HYPH|nr:iron ABC transporter permease [Devosia epidermidihirudinis]KKC38789.1 iron ABC transporter permease [Devosia epidermidihirudinis]